MLGAMGAAIDLVPCLDAVTNHPTVAVSTPRRHGMDGALETVEGHRPAALGDTDGLVVIITAYVTSRHDPLLSTNLIEHSYSSSTTDRRPKFPAPSDDPTRLQRCCGDDGAWRPKDRIALEEFGPKHGTSRASASCSGALFELARSINASAPTVISHERRHLHHRSHRGRDVHSRRPWASLTEA